MSEKKKNRPTYSQEFKDQAVRKCLEIGIAKAAKELDVAPSTLKIWRERAETPSKDPSDKPSYDELEKENRRLKKELGYVNEINTILKKSTAIFSSSQMGGLR